MNYQEFSEKYEKVPVEHYPHSVPADPVVSVGIHTYQHVEYIRECLDGILMQETDFPFEILLGEDASTDGTREICIEYADKHPDKIRLFLHSRENNIHLNGAPSGRFNFMYNLLTAKGKYIAICEGDDYWTDPLKLQKQVDFLEANTEYVLTGTSCKALLKSGAYNNHRSFTKHRIVGKHDLLFSNQFTTCTTVFKNFQEVPKNMLQYISGDIAIWMYLAGKGKLVNLPFFSSIYRRHGMGADSGKNVQEKFDTFFINRELILKYYKLNFKEKINCIWFMIKSTISILFSNSINRNLKFKLNFKLMGLILNN